MIDWKDNHVHSECSIERSIRPTEIIRNNDRMYDWISCDLLLRESTLEISMINN